MNGNTSNTSFNYINLHVYGQDFSIVGIKIRKDVSFQHLIDTYCYKTGIQKGSVKFISKDGVLLRGDKSIISLELEDNDIIETFISQTDVHNTPENILVKVLGLKNLLVEMTVEKQVSLENLKMAYSEYLNVQQNSIVFKFNKTVIRNEDTASSIGLKNGDIIKVSEKCK